MISCLLRGACSEFFLKNSSVVRGMRNNEKVKKKYINVVIEHMVEQLENVKI